MSYAESNQSRLSDQNACTKITMFIYIIVLLSTVAYVLISALIKKRFNYWNKKGIKGPKPLPVIGNFGTVMLIKESGDQFLKRLYEEYSQEKVVGLYRAFKPALLIRDPELIKYIMIKDFHIFQDRGIKPNNNRLNDNLFFTEGETWRILRQKMTPIFTSGKLRNMIPLINKCVDEYLVYVNSLVEKNIDYEIRALVSKYTLEVIGSCAFGLDLDTFSDKDNEFSILAKKIFTPTFRARIWLALEMLIPGIRKVFPKLSDVTRQYQEFFLNLVSKIMREREGKALIRKDFMDLMIELKEQGKISRRKEDGVSELEIDDEMIAAQALVFYSAGFETSAANMSFLLHELALHPEIQERLYEEISKIYEKYNGELTYDGLLEMNYMDMVLDESLRKHTVAGVLVRKASANYTFPGTNISIEKGTPIFISASGLHTDPKYFPNPDEFDPERFSYENKRMITSCSYLPFGEGPRNCIGMRFAKVQSMMGMAAFIKNFKVEPSKKTKPKLLYSPKSVTLTSQDGIWLKIIKR